MELKAKGLIIGILVFTVISAFGVSWLGTLNEAGLGEAQEVAYIESNFSKLNQVTGELEEIEDEITAATVEEGGNVLWGLMRSTWSTFKMIFTGFDFMKDSVTGTTAYGIPAFVTTFLIGIFLVILILSAIALIWGRDT